MHERSIYTPRGRVVGGSSSINSVVNMRGYRFDYDGWAEDFDLNERRFDKCLLYFIQEKIINQRAIHGVAMQVGLL